MPRPTKAKPVNSAATATAAPSPVSLAATATAAPSPVSLAATDPEGDKLALAHDAIVDQILAVAQGIRIVVARPKRQLKQGEVYEGETTDRDGETWQVYSQPPDPALLRWCAEQVKGKAAAKEATASAATLVIKTCVPGHDAEINRYLARLPEETLKRYGFDAATLAAIQAAAPSPG